jgi:hypothetical protein
MADGAGEFVDGFLTVFACGHLSTTIKPKISSSRLPGERYNRNTDHREVPDKERPHEQKAKKSMSKISSSKSI